MDFTTLAVATSTSKVLVLNLTQIMSDNPVDIHEIPESALLSFSVSANVSFITISMTYSAKVSDLALFGDYLVVGCSDGTAQLFHLPSSDCVQSWKAHSGENVRLCRFCKPWCVTDASNTFFIITGGNRDLKVLH